MQLIYTKFTFMLMLTLFFHDNTEHYATKEKIIFFLSKQGPLPRKLLLNIIQEFPFK